MQVKTGFYNTGTWQRSAFPVRLCYTKPEISYIIHTFKKMTILALPAIFPHCVNSYCAVSFFYHHFYHNFAWSYAGAAGNNIMAGQLPGLYAISLPKGQG
jgi:hypothetical protein